MHNADLLWFLLVSALNLTLLGWVTARRGLFSVEGFCLAFVAAAAGIDNLHLLVQYFWAADTLRLGADEFGFRIYPTLVHICGIGALMLGLSLANPRPLNLSVRLSMDQAQHIQLIGWAMVIIGALLYGTALVLVGAASADNFYLSLNSYRTDDLELGGFWYRGLDVLAFGLGLILASPKTSPAARAAAFAAMTAIMFLLSSNKGGAERAVLWSLFLLNVYNRPLFQRVIRPRWIVTGLLLLVISTGMKNFIVAGTLRNQPDLSLATVGSSAAAAIAGRYSDEGLYRGFCSMVNYIDNFGWEFHDRNVLRYTLTSWVPRIVNPFKDDHPFRNVGNMINPTGITNDPREASAPTLVGWAYWDNQLVSVILYLFVGGLLIGALRRYLTEPGNVYPHVLYIFFCLFGGVSSESGFLGTPYTLIFVAALVLAAWAAVHVYRMHQLRSTRLPADGAYPTRQYGR